MRRLPVTRLPWHPARLCSSLLRSLAPSQTLQQLAAIPGTQPDSAAACCDPWHPSPPTPHMQQCNLGCSLHLSLSPSAIPRRMHRISSELRSSAAQGPVSTGVGGRPGRPQGAASFGKLFRFPSAAGPLQTSEALRSQRSLAKPAKRGRYGEASEA